jgi:ABC-type sugar transport system ATPase subunit
MVEIRKLKKSYKNFCLDKIEFFINKGEFFTILGESGCGKSTLLRIIAGVEDFDEGEILIDGKSVQETLKEGKIAMVFQDSLLLPHLTVKGNILFGLKMRNISKAELEMRYQEVVKELEIEKLGQKYVFELSGGQKQRVSIGRALIMKPKLLLMDEPFSALDTNLRYRLQELLKKIQKKYNTTIIFVTHDKEEAFFLSNRIAVMKSGEIIELSEVEKLKKTKNDYISYFLKERCHF